jgi:RNA polymerase sigma-70 factor (ECF subfamily)
LFPGDPAKAARGRAAGIQGGPDSPDAQHPRKLSADPSNVIVQGFLDGRPEDVRQVALWARTVAGHRVWGFETTEDIVQAALLAVVQNLRDGRFDGGDLRAYVRRITKNMCITSYRRLKSRGEHVSLDQTADPLASAPSGTDLERRIVLERILEKLNQDCREIIVFAYVHGLSRKEIGRRLGISEEAARVKLCRCIKNARTLLNESE